MNILYITNKPVYPKIDGGCVAMENFLQNLLFQECKVTHIAISTQKHPFDETNYPPSILQRINCSSVEIDTRIKPIRAFVSLFKKSSYHIDRFYSPLLLKKIQELLRQQSFDCIILDSLYSTAHLSEIKSMFRGNIFIRTHNVESEIWRDLAQNEKNSIKKLILGKLAKDLKSYEIKTLNKADGIISISKDDVSIFEKMGVSTEKCVVSVSIPTNNTVNDYESTDLFHIGAMNWTPNIEATNRLIKLFPKISSQTTSKLHLAGSHFPENMKVSGAIKIHGFVENIFEFAMESGILVTPIISGSGVRIKILEMMSAGIPIITTEKGATGIEHQSKNCLIIAETDEEIVSESILLIKNKERRMEIGKNSRSYIQNNHSIEKISQQLIEFIR